MNLINYTMNFITCMASCYEFCYHMVMYPDRYAVCVRLSGADNTLAVTMVTQVTAG